MKVLRFLSILAVLFGYMGVKAQTVEMDWGQPMELEKGTFFHKIAGHDKDGYIALRSQGMPEVNDNKIWIEYYSSIDNSRESVGELILPSVNGTMSHYKDIFYVNGKLILFTTATSGTQKALYVQYLNNDGTLKNKPKEVGSIPNTNLPEDDFLIRLMDDGRIMISYHNTFLQYNGEPFTFKIVNSNLMEEVNESLELPFKERTFSLVKSEIGKSGNIYLLVKAVILNQKKSATSKGDATENIMVVYNVKRKEFNQFPIQIQKYIPTDVIFGLNKEEEIVVGGFFANKTSRVEKEFVGSFYQVINPRTLKIISNDPKKNVKVFDRNFLAEFADPRNGETPDLYNNYILKDMVFFENGTIAFIAENNYSVTKTIVDPATKSELKINYFYFNDILVCGVNKDGVMAWQLKLPKNQYSLDDNGYYHSYAVMMNVNQIKIIYNDNPSNLNNKDVAKTKELKNNTATSATKGFATMATIYTDGSMEKFTLFPKDDDKFIVVPTLMHTIKDRVLTYAQNGKEYKFGTFVWQ